MLSTEMNVIVCNGFGSPEVLQLSRRALPLLGPDEVLIKVAAAGINRADLLQRRGKYPPPSGACDILGMEVSGTITALGMSACRWKIGDKVCALLAGGGYAEYAAVSQDHCLLIPKNISLQEAAALPEAIVTVYANLIESGHLKKDETALIHGGSSGIGTTAIQMAKAMGVFVITTAGGEEKVNACKALGADCALNYKEEDFVKTGLAVTKGRGVDVVLDMIGGSYINRNLQVLGLRGRHISIATQSGTMAEIDVSLIMQKQLTLTGSTLRGRSKAEKSRLMAEIEAKIWPFIAAGKIKPVIYQTFPLKNAPDAHKVMESGTHIGKMVLEVS